MSAAIAGWLVSGAAGVGVLAVWVLVGVNAWASEG